MNWESICFLCEHIGVESSVLNLLYLNKRSFIHKSSISKVFYDHFNLSVVSLAGQYFVYFDHICCYFLVACEVLLVIHNDLQATGSLNAMMGYPFLPLYSLLVTASLLC
jgi:hypothetical protein